MANKTEIQSLLTLLDDPDPYIQDQVKSRLHELGDSAVPLLDQHKSEIKDENEKQRISDIIHSITFGNLEQDFMEYLEAGVEDLEDLEKGAFLLARFGNPTLRAREYQKKLDHFAGMIRDDIRYSMMERKQMRRLLNFVFDDLNFRGNTENYHHPANSYLDQVIDRRKGLPISLGMIVLFLARRVDLPFNGVNMPIHFMLKFEGKYQTLFVDPFDGGNIVSHDQCYYFLKKNGVDPKAHHFRKAEPIEILARSIRNMIHSYAKREEEDRVRGLKELMNLVEMMY